MVVGIVVEIVVGIVVKIVVGIVVEIVVGIVVISVGGISFSPKHFFFPFFSIYKYLQIKQDLSVSLLHIKQLSSSQS